MSVTRRAHPTGNVTWRAKVFFEGRVIAQRSFGRRVDAKRWEADQLAKLDAGSWIDPARGRMTFAALAEEWQTSRGHLAVRSQETTRFLLDKYVIPEIGAYPISGISAADVERVMSALTARGLATATRRRALSMMRLVFDYAIRDRRLSVNVARMVALPRGGTKREPHWLRPEQLGRLVMAVPPLCQPVVLFLGTTGCRFSEMAALRVDDVVQTPHGLGVRVHRAATQSKRTSGAVFGPTKTPQTRTVSVPAVLDEYVWTRVAFTAPGGYLFPSPTGGVWTNTNFRARSGWMEATRRAGVEGTTIHDLRHTAASLLIAAGADVKAVQVILGHSTATMTMDLYGHLFSEATWQAMERLPVIPLMQVPRALETRLFTVRGGARFVASVRRMLVACWDGCCRSTTSEQGPRAVIETTGSRRDAASTIFNLPDFRVIDAADEPGGCRRVLVESLAPPGCPSCGVVSTRVHARREQVVRDVPVAGSVQVVWAKRRWVCAEGRCGRRTFWERTMQVPARARSTVRLKDALVAAVIVSGRSAREAAGAHGVSWWLVRAAINAVVVLLAAVDDVPVRRLGIDEHRYRSVRWFRDETGSWRRFEPWMTTFVDVDTGAVLGVVDGRDSAGVGDWLKERSQTWRDRVEVVAIDPSAAFRKAIVEHLPTAAVCVDAFHLVQLANQMLTSVRQRRAREIHDRRGRALDPAWANRRLRLRAADTLSSRGWDRLTSVFATDDPTGQLEWAWAVKEHLRMLLKTTSLDQAATAMQTLRAVANVAAMPETDRLVATLQTWWPAIEVLIVTGVTNARTEAANTSIKNIKRTGRGFRNENNYRARILLTSAGNTAA